jgi:iron complex outermembrane receptor protein
MVDGINCTEQTKWGAFNERYLGLLDELERIEITQGVGSTLYGSGAVSGVINFITKTGKDFQGTELTSGYGSVNKFEETIKYGKKTSETDNDFYYFGYKQSHGRTPEGGKGDASQRYTPHTLNGAQMTNYSDREHSASNRYWDHFAPSFKFQSTIQRGDFTLRARYVHDKFEEPYFDNPGRLYPTANPTQYWDTADTYWFTDYFFIQPEITRQLSEVSRLKANVTFGMLQTGIEKLNDWYNRTTGARILEDGRRPQTYGEKYVNSQLFHYYDGFAKHKLTTGLELYLLHIGPDFRGENRAINNSGVVSRNIKPENLYYIAGVAEDIWQLTDRDTLFLGVRAENHNLTPASITPRAALSHDFSEKTNLKFLFNSGYRTPNWCYYTINRDAGKPDPDPERVKSFETHLFHKFDEKFSTTLIGYYTIYKDVINYWSTALGGNDSYYNFKEVKATGLEASADYKTKNLKLKLSHSFSRPVHASNDVYRATSLTYNLHDWALFPTNMTKAQVIINLIEDKCLLGITYLRPWGIRGQWNADDSLKRAADYINTTLTFKLNKNFDLQLMAYNVLHEDHPWWGAYTYDGTTRDVNPHVDYFVRLIAKF